MPPRTVSYSRRSWARTPPSTRTRSGPMIDAILRFSIARRWVVLFLVLVAAAAGVWNYQRLPIDAVPDITNVQVQINTQAPGYSPLEVEQRITFPIETIMTGLPH